MNKTLELSDWLKLTHTKWSESECATEFEYVNLATDYWNSDYEICVPVDKEKAIEIITFLKEAFNI